MPTIDFKKLPKEITDKYSIVSNAFRLDKIINPELDKYKNEPKDEINVEIGDTKQTEFYPQIKLMRWTNETNFSVRLIDTNYNLAKISTLQDKIIWNKDNTKIEFFDYAENSGGYKMVWYLKSKPATNKVEFSIQTKGLDFFYQPELTPEEIAEGCIRPENVVGSYAVYHQTKGGMNDIYGKEYKTGKAFHIYRPKIIDTEGKEIWGILNIDVVNGIYSVEIPQDFLDKAVYPIKSNDTFGHATASWGASTLTGSADDQRGTGDDSPSSNGVVTSISWYNVQGTYDDGPQKLGLYQWNETNSNYDLLAETNAVSGQANDQYVAVNLTTNPDIYTSGKYIMVHWGEEFSLAYDSVTGRSRYVNNDYPGSWIDPWTVTPGNIEYSIYATYTPSGAGATPDWRDPLQRIASTQRIISSPSRII